jgi:competence protein ComGC
MIYVIFIEKYIIQLTSATFTLLEMILFFFCFRHIISLYLAFIKNLISCKNNVNQNNVQQRDSLFQYIHLLQMKK